MRLIAHLSDLHFGRIDEAAAHDVAADIARQKVDLVAISGDLTQRARTTEFRAAQAFLERIAAPIVVVPGNHDIVALNLWDRLVSPRRKYQYFIGQRFPASFVDDEMVVIGIDTTRRAQASLDWSRGRIGRKQLSAVSAALPPRGDPRLKLVVAHHALADLDEADADDEAPKPLAALATLDIDVILGGHHHHPDARLVAEADLLIVHAATALSTRRRGSPNSYNLLRYDQGRLEAVVRVVGADGMSEQTLAAYNRRDGRWRTDIPPQATGPAEI